MDLGEFYSENTHVNDVTGCVIWEGKIVKGVPVIEGPLSNIPVRQYIHMSLNGLQPKRTKYESSCENPNCVKMEHIKIVEPDAASHDYPWPKVEEAVKLRDEGYRQDIIALRMEVDPSTISKWLKAWKARSTAQEPT